MEAQETPRDRAVGELASRQHRVVAHWDLLGLGLGVKAIQYGLRTGRLYRLYRGVYAVGCASVSWRGRIMAAVLACGPAAVASHLTAGMLRGIRPAASGPIDVTVPGRSRRSRPGIRVHAVRALHPEDRDVIDGIPVTSIARTLLDLAEVVTPRQLARAVEAAEKQQLFDLAAIERLCARSNGRHGVRPLRAAIAAYVEPPWTQAESERLFFEICDGEDIPRPLMNVLRAGRLVDAVWDEARLVAEIDSRTHHLTTAAFEEDRRRDADLMVAGYRVLRITWQRLRDEPEEVAATLRALLARG